MPAKKRKQPSSEEQKKNDRERQAKSRAFKRAKEPAKEQAAMSRANMQTRRFRVYAACPEYRHLDVEGVQKEILCHAASGFSVDDVLQTCRLPLQEAAFSAAVPVVQALLEAGADPNRQASEEHYCESPLHTAVEAAREPTMGTEKDRCQVVQLLLNANADVTVLDSDGRTPLERALYFTHGCTPPPSSSIIHMLDVLKPLLAYPPNLPGPATINFTAL